MKIVMSETTTYDAKLWDKAPGKERVYVTKEGRDICYYDVNEDCLYGRDLSKWKPEWKAKLLTELRAAFRPVSDEDKDGAELVSTYVSIPCTDENDELSQTKVGVYRTKDGRTFERILKFADH